MRVNEKFKNSWASTAATPTGLISLFVFSSTSGYAENLVDELIPQKNNLDRLFYVKHGEKRLVKWFEDLEITVQNGQYCADMVAAMYNNKWSRLYHAMVESLYEPLENYNMTEHEEYDGDDLKTGTDKNHLTHGESVDTTYGKEETVTHGDTLTTYYDTNSAHVHGEKVYNKGEKEVELEHGEGEKTKTTYNTNDAHVHGEQIENKTFSNDGDTVETVIDANDPATTKNKVFGFNSTADAGVMDSMSINTGTSKTTTKKDDKEIHTGTDTDRKTGDDTVEYFGSQKTTERFTDYHIEHSGTDTDRKTGNDRDEHRGTTKTKYSDKDTVEHSGTDLAQTTYNSNLNRSYERDLTRSGNIGVTTSQQMLESEIELRKKLFIEIMFADICELFCIPIY